MTDPTPGQIDQAVAYPHLRGRDTVTEECLKCLGKGHISAFAGIDGGRCWACMGRGSRSVLVSSVRARQRRRAKRARERAATDSERAERVGNERDAAIAAIIAAFPRFAEALDETGRPQTFAAEEMVLWQRQGTPTTEVVEHYRWTLGETVHHLTRNRFRGQCHTCQAQVMPAVGWVGQAVDGWRTYCADHHPA